MKYCLFTAFFALLVFACGEVGRYSSDSDSKCGIYNSLEQFCFEGKIYPRCGSEEYNPIERFCFENKFYLLCGNDEYNPSLEFCFERKPYLRCGRSEMNPNEQFCFDSKVYKKCGGQNYNPAEEFCWDGELKETCGSIPYDFDKEFCIDFNIYPMCNKMPFDPKEQACLPDINKPDDIDILYYICGGNKDEYSKDSTCASLRYKLCGEKDLYDFNKKFCGEDNIAHDLCKGNRFDTSKEFCGTTGVKSMCRTKPCGETLYCLEEYDDSIYECVGGSELKVKPPYIPPSAYDSCGVAGAKKRYEPTKEFCENDKIYPKCGNLELKPDECCNGVKYKKDVQFCFRDELYPNCNKGTIDIDGYPNIEYPYNPLDSGCFGNGKLYPNCANEDSRGTCVHNSLLRCRQEGKGDNYIRDPLPGMICVDNNNADNLGANIGAIVGETERENRKIGVAQIGRQVWLRENANNGLFNFWAEANGLPKECNSTDEGECNPTRGSEIHQATCPLGFFMARDDDWNELMKYAGDAAIAGGRLKSQTGWNNDGNGTDSYGFSAKPYGYYEGILSPGGLVETDSRSMWWSENSLAASGSYWTIISKDTELRHAFQLKGLYKVQIRCMYYYDKK